MNAPVPALASAPTADAAAERSEVLSRLREIVAALECGDDALFESKLAQLLRERESGLFLNLGRITRELHCAVQNIRFDGQLTQFVNSDMPDAASRLDYVMQVTEKAAHRTLDLVEQSRGLAATVAKTGEDLSAARTHAISNAQSPSALLSLYATVQTAQDRISVCTAQLRENLSSLAQAQEYQDLSGQVIRRVITLVRNVESALIELLRASGSRMNTTVTRETEALAGPAVPGVNAATSQQDADALLAELGF